MNREEHIEELRIAGVITKETAYCGNKVYMDQNRVFISPSVEIGEGTIIWPNTYLLGKTKIGENCEIGPDTTLKDTILGNHCIIKRGCELTSSSIGNSCAIHPFCYASESCIGDNCTIWVNVSMYHAILKENVTVHRDTRLVWCQIGQGSNLEASCQIKYADIGTKCQICHSVIEGEKFNDAELADGKRSIRIEHSCKIGPNVYIHGQVLVNPEAEITRSEIEDAFIGTSVIVHGARVQDSVVHIGSVIEQCAWIHDNAIIHGGCKIAREEIARSTLLCDAT